ncbi:uncharacterized protein [Drosophila pseudoobscura]|uniref:Uncharacterized protein n=1 Tax=Drosophila pseudoobscura pseudoobscura TaxID=46245 RepID=A0A6I8UKD3_DROPS|nr:uncharacterized protein LOC4817501 [Drosophila pseudoobscura]
MCRSHRRLKRSDEKLPPCMEWPRKRCPPPDPATCDELQRRGLKRSADECRWHYWSHRNDLAVRQLAKLLEGCPEKVAGFLFDLTLQNYNRLLHPRRCGYSACHVPYCHPYVCERYMGIFDDQGNLRDPTHPRSLFQLLKLLQNFLKGQTPGCVPMPFDSSLREEERAPVVRHRSMDPIGTRCLRWGVTELSGPSRPMQSKQKGKKSPGQLKRKEDDEKSEESKGYAEIRGSLEISPHYRVPGKDGDAVSFYSQDLSDDSRYQLMIDDKGRRRGMGSHSAQLGNLRSEQALYLKRLIAKMNERRRLERDPQKVLRAMSQLDLEDGGPAQDQKTRRNEAVAELSKFYTKTVSSDRAKSRTPPHALPLPRKYYGEPIPVLYHEPFDSAKEWTWIRRHPSQGRLLADGKVGFDMIKRYRRESVENEMERGRARWSIHSAFSLASSPRKARSSINSRLGQKKPKK